MRIGRRRTHLHRVRMGAFDLNALEAKTTFEKREHIMPTSVAM